jgi:hypothetical protein
MPATDQTDNEAFARFLRRVWRDDVSPLLVGENAAQRRTAAQVGGKLAAATGLFLDGVLRLRGRPFTRSLMVLGSTLGALLPDVWDWKWLREQAGPRQREVVAEQVQRRAADLPLLEALQLFQLSPQATQDELKRAWREISQRWHPDKAPDEAGRAEYHVRFLVYRAAYDRLRAAYEQGKLPVQEN